MLRMPQREFASPRNPILRCAVRPIINIVYQPYLPSHCIRIHHAAYLFNNQYRGGENSFTPAIRYDDDDDVSLSHVSLSRVACGANTSYRMPLLARL